MQTNPILASNVSTDLINLEEQVTRLEQIHKLVDVEVIPFVDLDTVRVTATYTSAYFRQFHYAEIIRGSAVRMQVEYAVGFGDASIPGQYAQWQFRYYQQIPNIYSAAQKAAGTNYIVLDSGQVNIALGNFYYQPVTMEAAVTDSIRGTYGRLEIWNNASTVMYGGRSYMSIYALEFVK